MNWKQATLELVLFCCGVLQAGSFRQDVDVDGTAVRERQLVLRVVGPNGRPVVGAQVGTGLNIFEDSQGHPPQTITMWLRGQKRLWPFRSDAEGQVVLTGEDTEFRHFYAQYLPAGWVGYRRLLEGSSSGRVVLRVEPACHVHGQLTSTGLDRLGCPVAKTVAFLYDSRDRLLMYFVSEQGRYEFLLPGGRYELECVGEGPAGIETERVRVNLDIEKGQPALDVGAIDLAATRLAELFGEQAPDLAAIDHWRGQKPARLSRLQGNVVVLVFWGGWSRPCLQTMPQLIELHDLYAEQGVVIIGIHDNSVKTVPELEAELTEARQLYWGRRDVPFAVGIDSGPGRGAVHEDYGVDQWPTTIVIDRAGHVAGKFKPWGELQAELPRLLSDPLDRGFTP
ncbi:MAG: TlpA family protein disulfide reductase [Phycisphaerales bacterium]|nr:MAG: TlpA family protein disulfide reductase [Phycisphaerales bacterium]